MIDLNFSRIRNHDGSQDNGFEELVCQLAHLSPPENAKYFVRKDGAGGDAGVECYWKLSDGSEHAWQAKYFLEALDSSQWAQISESVEAALKKHPTLKKYYVCLPRDWNDSRKLGRGGKPVNSAWDKWQEHVKVWQGMAELRGMDVDFSYWCKHEISLLLQRDQAEFAGRARYWFGGAILGQAEFERLAIKSKTALGDRYTPEYHLELPIAKTFEALGETPSWWGDLERHVGKWVESISNAELSISKAIEALGRDEDGIKGQIDSVSERLLSGLRERTFLSYLEQYIEALESLKPLVLDMVNALLDVDHSKGESTFDQIRSDFYRFENATRELLRYLKSNPCQAALHKSVLLDGEAGIGKSHLLCDVVFSRLQNMLPTVFMLGQHYCGGCPVSALKELLDLSQVSNEEFLGALDAAGEAKRCNALIVIDAINEGNSRGDWPLFVSGLLSDLKRFRHISVVVSCRETYVEWLVPENVIGKLLVKVTHSGFKGFEHRAASNYLSRQGILKPSAPIISPEFTNPLFLKTCCNAILEQGLTAFPKGLTGISSLLDFYIRSVEKSISKIKRYRLGERVAESALRALALKLYPNHQFGLEVSKAVSVINGFDSRPNVGDTLFDLLLHEGVLSEDVIFDEVTERRDKVVIRFTYERFSDYFIASSLVEPLKYDDLVGSFSEDGVFSPILNSGSYFKYVGILSAISIIIAEKFSVEIVDLLSDEMANDDWLFDQIFVDTLQWRAPSSFTNRTNELLNSIPESGFSSRRLDILMALSTEPSHPWNAELIHRNLCSMDMPNRDKIWSAHVALSDSEESEEEGESIERALIDWACFGSLEGVENERIRLCAIILIWMTSSTNRKVRDQSTKSAVRILAFVPDLLIPLLDKFSVVDDAYILERLYAIAYGVVTNCSDENALSRVSKWVWDKQFSNGRPFPHLLLRDYARGLVEYAHFKGVLDSSINIDSVRPPYESCWPLSIPSDNELKELIGEDFSYSIRSSLMGFPGDFGNYTMSCIHDWSPSAIASGVPQTVHDLQLKFADDCLQGELKERFVAFLDSKKNEESKPFDFKKVKIEFVAKKKDEKPSEFEALKDEIAKTLDEEQKEYFRWAIGLGRANSLGAFSRKAAQRWICRRAFELGWRKELFEDFEKYYLSYSGRSEPSIERIGKKYQWIALYEFLAHLADNCCYIDPGYGDVDYSQYFGPWQIHKRDIDPTLKLRATGDTGWDKWEKEYWWQPFVFNFYGEAINEIQQWLWDEGNVPDFERLLKVSDKEENSWLVLKAFSNWKKDPVGDNEKIPSQDAWYRVNSCIIHKSELDRVIAAVKGRNLCDPSVLKNVSTGGQGFFREFPWHPVFKDIIGWSADFNLRPNVDVKNLVPVSEYEWGDGGRDKSLESSISIYLPARELVEGLNLFPSMSLPGYWFCGQNNLVFYDPSVSEKGPSVGLIRTDYLYHWLEENDLQLVWLVGGEKQLFTHWASEFYGRLVYSGIYTLSDKGVDGALWFKREEP